MFQAACNLGNRDNLDHGAVRMTCRGARILWRSHFGSFIICNIIEFLGQFKSATSRIRAEATNQRLSGTSPSVYSELMHLSWFIEEDDRLRQSGSETLRSETHSTQPCCHGDGQAQVVLAGASILL